MFYSLVLLVISEWKPDENQYPKVVIQVCQIEIEGTMHHHPQDPCMVYLLTFTMQINQMWVNILVPWIFMDPMGHGVF